MDGSTTGLTVNGTGLTLTDDDRNGGGVKVSLVKVSLADAVAKEGYPLVFTVKLERAAPDTVTMRYATEDGTAKEGVDYTAVSGKLTFASGETERLVMVPTLDDSLDEGSETLTLRLSDAVNASLAVSGATGTITNNDRLPGAWIARFGRTMSSHVMEAVDTRLHGGAVGSHLTVGGVGAIPWSEASGDSAGWPKSSVSPAAPSNPAAWNGSGWAGRNPDVSPSDAPMGVDHPWGGEREMSLREVLAGSAFRLTSKDAAPGSDRRWTAWGSGATTRFEGRDGPVTLDGDVVGATLGLDVDWSRWTAGMALGYNDGRGSFDDAESGDRGKLETTLASLHPYLRWSGERLSVWGLLGHGQGEYTVTPEELGKSVQADMSMNMAGAGARRTLGTVAYLAGMELALRSDAMFVWMHSDEVSGHLRETRTRTSHVRLLLEGGWAFALDSGGTLTSTVEGGLRHDAGDAETGGGLEVGGSLRYAARNLTIEVSARGLVTHEDRDFEQWGVSGQIRFDPGADGRGLSMRLDSAWEASSGSAEQLWAEYSGGISSENDDPKGRLDAEVGYGFVAGRGLLTPYVGMEFSEGGEGWRAGARWQLGPAFDVSLEAGLGEFLDNGIILGFSIRW